MAEWGRKQYSKPWPSRTHVWTWGAFFLSCLFFVFAVWRDGQVNWTAAERLYTREYLEASSPRRQQIEEHMEKAGVRGAGAAQIAAQQRRYQAAALA